MEDIYTEFRRLEELGINFEQPPMAFGEYMYFSFYDPCGNLVLIMQTENAFFFGQKGCSRL